MIIVSDLSMTFDKQTLFKHVDLKFTPGNCYGIIGANGAGKSTFLRILTGELDSTTGNIAIDPDKRVSVLKQNQNAYDEFTVMDTFESSERVLVNSSVTINGVDGKITDSKRSYVLEKVSALARLYLIARNSSLYYQSRL